MLRGGARSLCSRRQGRGAHAKIAWLHAHLRAAVTKRQRARGGTHAHDRFGCRLGQGHRMAGRSLARLTRRRSGGGATARADSRPPSRLRRTPAQAGQQSGQRPGLRVSRGAAADALLGGCQRGSSGDARGGA